MENLPLVNPSIGIERIERATHDLVNLPASHDAEPVGAQPLDNLAALYNKPSLAQGIRALTVPRIEDPSILMPARFDAAFLDVVDKVGARAEAGDPVFKEAARHLRPLCAARKQCSFNLTAVSRV